MRYSEIIEWEWNALEDIVNFNPEEIIAEGQKIKQINLDKLIPYDKFIHGYEIVEYTGKGRKFRNQDVLVPQICSALQNGKTALVTVLDEDEIGIGSNWYMVLRARKGKIDPNFLYYLTITPLFRELAMKSLEGSTNSQYINLARFKKSIFAIPPYDEQLRIASVLSGIDDKIKKNMEVCQSVESLLTELFHKWFISYNFPNANGRPFRDSGGGFQMSDMGCIPEGWKTGHLADLGKIVSGGTPSKKVEEYYSKGGISWITPRDLSKSKTKFIEKGAIDITESGLNNSSAQLLPRGAVLFSSRAPIGYISIAANELTTNQGFRSIIPKPSFGTGFVYYLLLNKTQEITSMASGTTFKEISTRTLERIRIVIPDEITLCKFKEETDCFMRYQENLEKENQLLAAIRDKLLLLLMMGAVKIPEKG
ncbi:MAG: restriction endonuclease subunit S [Lachnospiraceae bacterium]|nr:restriction endonuclease subunit S [Lachnospiraceae bacterium]